MTPTILCIDDDAGITRMLQYTLTPKGFAVFSAPNVRDALEIVRMIELDLILLDIMLPDIDGFSFLELLTVEPRNRDVPVIVLSGCITAEARLLADKCGAVAFIQKPFQLHSLVPLVQRTIAAHRAARSPVAASN
jgi:DNA-binding response OmpR family regulator